MDEVEVSTAELPEAIQAWLAEQPAVVVSIEHSSANHVIVRALPHVSAELLARAQVTMAQFHEALMNLT